MRKIDCVAAAGDEFANEICRASGGCEAARGVRTLPLTAPNVLAVVNLFPPIKLERRLHDGRQPEKI